METFFKNPEPGVTYQILIGRSLAQTSSTNFQAGIFKQSLSPSEFRRLYQQLTKFDWQKKTHSLYYYYHQADLIWVSDSQVRTKVYRRWVLDQEIINNEPYDFQLLKIRKLPSQANLLPPKTVQAQTKIHKFQFQNAEVKLIFEIVVDLDDSTNHLKLLKNPSDQAIYQIRFELPTETVADSKVIEKYLELNLETKLS